MAENVVVRARIDEQIKSEAATVLAEMGLTISDAFRIMMIKVAKEKTLPFDIGHPIILNTKKSDRLKKNSVSKG